MDTITPEQWQRIQDGFERAAGLEPDAQTTCLDALGLDAQERGQLEALLDANIRVGDFLQRSVEDQVPAALAEQDRNDEMIGRRIGPYRLVSPLGRGGMGEVYLAQRIDGQFQQQVAVKLIRRGMDTAHVTARFHNERQVLANLQHPSIARLCDGGTTDPPERLPYIAMEYVQGVRIDEWCDRHRLTIEKRIELFCEICAAVQHAHQNLVIHRDLKPANILVTANGDLKLLDFGIARLLAHETDAGASRTAEETLTLDRRLTPAYASPEQIRGEPMTTASDVYALGVILYELLTGRRPYQLGTGTAAELEQAICERSPTRPSTAVMRDATMGLNGKPHAPIASSTPDEVSRCRSTDPKRLHRRLRGDLETIVLTALNKEPPRRYATAQGLSDDLRRLLRNEPIVARPPSKTYLARMFLRRNALAASAAAAILVTLIVGMLGTSFGMVRAGRHLAEAQRQTAIAETRTSEALAAKEAERSEREKVEQRERELEQIAAFQASMLSDLNPGLMGARLLDDLRASVAAVLELAHHDAETDQSSSEDRTIASFDELVSDVNMTNIALRLLDRDIIQRSLKAIEDDFAGQPLVQARLLQTLADTLRDLGLPRDAMEPQSKALALRRELLGDDDPLTLTSISNMGVLLSAQGRTVEAEPYYTEALATRLRVLGEDHRDTLTSMNIMGGLLRSQGKFVEAEPYHTSSLAGFRAVLGDEHPDTLTAVNNMGGLLEAQGRLAEAEPYYREALEVRLRVLGEDDANTLASINNMGYLLRVKGELTEAEEHLRDALEGRRRVLGDEHPATLASFINMGGVLEAQGKLSDAEPYYRNALDGFRRTLGRDHPRTLIALNNMGGLMLAQGKPEEAEPYYRLALEGHRRAPGLGDEHPNTLVSINNMGKLLQVLGDLDGAEAYYRESLDGRRRVLGDDHPSTLTAINNMAHVLQLQGRLDEAEPYYREALDLNRRIRGDDHPQTLISLDRLSALLRGLGDFMGAESLSAEAVRRARAPGSALAADHWLIGAFLANHARTLAELDRRAEAEAGLLEAHAVLSTALGDDHERTIDVVQNLIDLYNGWHIADPLSGAGTKAAAWRNAIHQRAP